MTGIQGNKQTVIDRVINNEVYTGKVLQHKKVRGGLWVVLDNPYAIVYVKVEVGSGKDKGWVYYKSITESEHPYYYDCPIEFLNMVPRQCQEWRDKVIAFHQKKVDKKKVVYEVGMTIALEGSTLFYATLTGKINRCWYGKCSDGILYRIPRKMMGEIIKD